MAYNKDHYLSLILIRREYHLFCGFVYQILLQQLIQDDLWKTELKKFVTIAEKITKSMQDIIMHIVNIRPTYILSFLDDL